jgi:TRAP transporter TAXI family solute receptor
MEESMKRSLAVLLFLTLALSVFAQAQKVQRYSFSGSNPGGTWYTMAGGLVQLLNDKMPANIRFDMVASGGSVENTRRIAMNQADITMSYSSHMWEAKNGKGILEGRPSDNMRVLFEIYSSSHYFVTLKSKKINTMQDLEGKKVVLGSPGSGSSDNSRRAFAALGIKVKESELAFADAARALQDGDVDAVGMSGHPASGIIELATSKDILVIPFSQSDLEKITAITPFFDEGVMPANVYKGQTQPVPCFYFSVYLVVAKAMPDDVVQKIMEIVLSPEGRKYLASVHPQFKDMRNNPAGVKVIDIAYHPVAEAYWKAQTK